MPDSLHMTGARPTSVEQLIAGAVELVGQSSAITRVQDLVRRAASGDAGILLVAERGIDVPSVARELHARSHRAGAAFVHVECAVSGTPRLDHVLFGENPVEPRSDLETCSADSRIAAARGGTLFLQDVTELPAAVQARLARITRDREARVHGVPVVTEFRLIAAAGPGIDEDVHAHRFRPDLYRRLAAARIDLPALRDRAGDVPALATRLLEDLCVSRGCAPRTLTQPALALLGALSWPGNLDELHDVIARVVNGTEHDVIHIEHVLPALRLDRAPAAFVPLGSLREARLRFEREYIAAVLQHHAWRMADAARTLGIQRPNLYRKTRQLGIPLARVSE
jgi:two-component system response regulator AtoC